MRYKIVVDSCCELPQDLKNDERFEIVPLTLIVGDCYEKEDNMAFDQREFLDAVASCPECPKSACPSPERYRTAYETEAERVYVVTLSSKLSGSYNSAVLGKNLYHEKYGEKDIYVIDSKSAACGETQIAYKIMELEEQELSFEEITGKLEQFVKEMNTYFVLENLDNLRKNGRLTRMQALVTGALRVKLLCGATREGEIEKLGQGLSIRQTLARMVSRMAEDEDHAGRRLVISYCNCQERAEHVLELVRKRCQFKEVVLAPTGGIATVYAYDGGIVAAF